MLWLPQAALLAWAVQAMQGGALWRAALLPAAGVLLLGVLRAGCEAWGARRMYAAAREHLSTLRVQVAQALARRSPLDRQRAQSGQAASVIAEQAEAIVPYLVRYKPARWKVLLVPLVILAVVTPLSWIAALILLVAAPLIPVFMALVGMGAQAASRAQMVEMGSMNAFLLDRLRGLATLRALGAVDATAERLDASSQSVRRRTMLVLRIAFLSSAVLELFSALGVAMAAAFIGFSLLGSINFGTWGRELSLGRACSSCCWRPHSSSRCASWPPSGTTRRPAKRGWPVCMTWWPMACPCLAPACQQLPSPPPPWRWRRRPPSTSVSCALLTLAKRAYSTASI
ncbi:hypothetical protein BA896_017575 [Janthinobacterium lividum]|uniref:ABC transmembrane type-1 domain-containing protein n=1 Tax=Janthinobacterium lividum TaxID=29581 RepID=A0A1E8PKP9_9BURK|nr:hypothetical protein BA896_017575 [Janthinobacterium lividum]